MSRYEDAFPDQICVFLIAIHVTPEPQDWTTDISVASGEGADGVILIADYHTHATNEDVLAAYNLTRLRFSRWFIGINLLGYPLVQAVLHAPQGVSGIWSDQSGIEEDWRGDSTLKDARQKLEVFHLQDPPLLMPSVAMKYQVQPKDLGRVTQMAARYADVTITSGQSTGKPPSLEKIKAMRVATTLPLGIASGIDSENVRTFIELGVDVFIVNTSISTSDRLDSKKVAQLRRVIPRH